MRKVKLVRTHIGVSVRNLVLTGIVADKHKVEMAMEEKSGIINMKVDDREFFLSPGNYFHGEYDLSPTQHQEEPKAEKKVKDATKS